MNRRNIPDFSPIECSICTDPFTDPRALPCGHSYCGPPKICLKGVERQSGLKCAVCNETFKLKLSELKPLFGIRDFLHQSTAKPTKNKRFEVICEKHAGAKVLFWCKWCRNKVCRKCFDAEHESHALVNFRKYLKETIKPIYAQFQTRADSLLSKAIQLNNQLRGGNTNDNSKTLVARRSTEIQSVTKKWESVEKFIQNPHDEVNLNVIESFLSQPFKDLEKIEKDLRTVRASKCANFKLRTDFNFNSEVLSKFSYLDFNYDMAIFFFFFSFHLAPVLGYIDTFLLSACYIALSFYHKDLFVMFLLYKIFVLEEAPGFEVGSISVPYTKTAQVKIRILYSNSNRKLRAEITLQKYSWLLSLLDTIPYMGELEICLPALGMKNNISMEGKLNSLWSKSHQLDIKLLPECETLKLNLLCNIFFGDEL